MTEIKFDKRNYRIHDKKNKDLIKKSLLECGAGRSILIDAEGEIIAGNGVFEQASKLKIPTKIIETDGNELIVVKRNDISTEDDKRKRLAVMDNSASDLSDFDIKILTEDFTNIELADMGIEVPNIDIEAEIVEDEAPEVEEKSISKLGDIWILGNHRLMCGDSTDAGSVSLLMDGQKADMVFTDPPYGINEKGDRSKRGGICKGNKLKDFKDDTIDYAVKAYEIVNNILKIENQVWWGANYYCHSLPQSNNWFVWDKRVEEKQKDDQSDCELAWVKSKKSSIRIFRHLWKGMIKASENGPSRIHPTQKPIALAVWAFDYFDNIKSVLDLFGGSGSTLIACEQTNRKCFMMELDEHYCDVIIKRWQNLTKKDAIRLSDNKTFNEVSQ